jgi:transcriptional regulator with XRE-family HTH domain
MIKDDQKDGAVRGDATVVNLSEERRVRERPGPRLHTRRGSSVALGAIENAGGRGGQLLEDMARAGAAAQIHKFVKEARKSRGYSQGELAKRIGVTQARISQWENMESSGETIDIISLFKIAIVCDFALKLEWGERTTKEPRRRKAQPGHDKQEGRPRDDQSRHDRGEM